MASPAEVDAMRRALVLAAAALGSTSPNPNVGCVLIDAAGLVIAEGRTAPGGRPHAEAVALAGAGPQAAGATAVVTLEPCGHVGRTPPCAGALADAGVRRVVYAVDDPNPVAAGGAAALRARGVDVEAGVLAAEASLVTEAWLTAVRLGRPFVTWKYGASLDGRIAAADGSSRWVTGPEARADGHRLRAECDAVVVGSGTLLADDPHLAVRGAPVVRQPLRVVVDSQARTRAGMRVLDGAAATLIAVAEDADAGHLAGLADVVRLPRAAAGLDLHALLAALHERDVRSVLLEGGPTLAGSFVAARLVDRVVGYVAPVVLGGGGLSALGGAGAPSIDQALRLRLDDVTRLGGDVRLIARPGKHM